MQTINIYHKISFGHIVENSSECQHLHGHDFHFDFEIQNKLNTYDHIYDYLMLKDKLCNWLNANWKNKFLVFHKSSIAMKLFQIDSLTSNDLGIVDVPFQPDIQNLAQYIVTTIGNQQLKDTYFILTKVTITQSENQSATYKL